ncbi:MAG TPA: hypothetical protein VGO40_20245 [Longimicrobium sp.]|jgi:hypothetical protein|nr:hypothetical protein [Longimicrobium sp.]
MTPENQTQPTQLSEDQADRRAEVAWSLFTELRKELVETQALRTRVIGLKVAFVSATAAVVTGLDRADSMLLTVPAFAAIFFDVLINSYSFSVKRIGWYTWFYIEPLLRKEYALGNGMPLWEEFMRWKSARQYMATVGNLGLTLLVCASAAVALYPFRPVVPAALGAALLLFFSYDAWSSWFVKRHQFRQPSDVAAGTLRVPLIDRPPVARFRRLMIVLTAPFRWIAGALRRVKGSEAKALVVPSEDHTGEQ